MSCASLRLPRELKTSSAGWAMYGRDAVHSSMTEMTSTRLEQIWNHNVNAGFGNFSPIIKNGIVYVGTLKGEIYALDVVTGKEFASKTFNGAIFSGPAISDSIMVVCSSQSDKNIFAYDIYSGSIIWSKQIADVESSPTILKSEIFVATVKGDFYKFDLQTGAEIFHKNFIGPIRSSPAVDDSLCVFGCDDGNVYGISAVDGRQIWKYDVPQGGIWCSASMNDSSVFIGTNGGRLLALGKDGKLEFDFATDNKILSMPITDERCVYFGCDDGNFYALNIHSGALIWKVHIDAPITSSASQTTNQVFFGGLDKNLYVIEKSDGKVAQEISLPGRVRTQPAIWKNHLVVGAEDSDVYGFEIK